MARKSISSILVSLLISLGALGLAPAAGAATTRQLVLSQSQAFAVLGYWCGGIKEHVYATGFASNGYPAGDAYLETTCSGSGRGGHPTTHTAWASATWTWYGVTRAYAKLASAPVVSTTFSATDSHGDRVYNSATAAFLETTAPPVVAPAAPTGVTATAFRTGEEGESGPQEFQVGWTPAQETAGLITSSTITATPVGSTAPVVTKTISGSGTSTLVGYVEPNTTYKITVVNTDEEGTSETSEPHEAKTLTTVAEVLAPPIVITEAASAVTQASATLNGDVNPAGEELSLCQFEYGTTESYGTTVSCTSLPGEGENPVPVSAPVTGLTPNTTYHYRLFAASPGGATYGFDQTFATVPTPGEVPAIKRLSPKAGPATGGTSVTITGFGFTEATAVMFGSNEAVILSVNSNSSITVQSPAGTIGTVNVTVTTPGGTSTITPKDRFKYKKK